MNTTYGFGTTLNVSYEETIPRVKEALKAEGFGVLTEIDVRQTLREKLGTEMEPYIILGACNPQLAHHALEQEPDIGLLLPCNVVVRSLGQGSRVELPTHRRCWAWWATSNSIPSPRKRNSVCNALLPRSVVRHKQASQK